MKLQLLGYIDGLYASRSSFRMINEQIGFCPNNNLYIEEIAIEFKDKVSNLSLGYADNDLGIATNSCLVNPVWAFGIDDNLGNLLNEDQWKSAIIKLNPPFLVPKGKYVFVSGGYNSTTAQIRIDSSLEEK